MSIISKTADVLVGKRLKSSAADEQKVGVFRGIPLLGLDALGSAAYGPEALLTILIAIGFAGLNYVVPLTAVILALLAILTLSYRQTITAYPQGGGGYTVARENLGARFGLLAAAALMLDYVLNVAVGIAAGVGALVSAVPALHPHILVLCLALLVLITLINLRGVRESGTAFAPPTYVFIVSLLAVIGLGIVRTMASGGHPHPVVPLPQPTVSATAGVAGIWLLLRAFASGCTAMTGVEAISNGVPSFSDPAPERAKQTLSAIAIILGLLLIGIAYLSHAYHIMATDPSSPQYQSILSQIVQAVMGRGVVYYVTLASVLAVLCLSANTSFAGFPRLCRLVAEDGYLPIAFANTGRRLVYTEGIVILAALSGILLIIFKGVTDRLIPLFAIGAFLTFTLSQAGMVQHWRRQTEHPSNRSAQGINMLGAVATGIALAIILVAKFKEGAWITVVLIPLALYVFTRVKHHYDFAAEQVQCDVPLDLAELASPIVIVPIQNWNKVAERALRFAYKLSQSVEIVHIRSENSTFGNDLLVENWDRYVETPCLEAGLTPPHLRLIDSPYRRVFQPLLDTVSSVVNDNPGRQIAVIIPELVESRWWEYLLHNQRATVLKARLLLSGESHVVVVSVPWYLQAGEENAACR